MIEALRKVVEDIAEPREERPPFDERQELPLDARYVALQDLCQRSYAVVRLAPKTLKHASKPGNPHDHAQGDLGLGKVPKVGDNVGL